MGIANVAMTAMTRATLRLDASVHRVAKAQLNGEKVDLAAEAAERAKARESFSKGVAMLRAINRIDIKA